MIDEVKSDMEESMVEKLKAENINIINSYAGMIE